MPTDDALHAYIPFLPAVKTKQPPKKCSPLREGTTKLAFYVQKSKYFKFFLLAFCLSSIIHSACLADDGDFHLTGIGHFILNLLGYLARKELGLLVVDLVGTNDNTKLATGLYSIGLCYTGIRHRKLLKVVQTFDVSLNNLAGRAPEMASHT